MNLNNITAVSSAHVVYNVHSQKISSCKFLSNRSSYTGRTLYGKFSRSGQAQGNLLLQVGEVSCHVDARGEWTLGMIVRRGQDYTCWVATIRQNGFKLIFDHPKKWEIGEAVQELSLEWWNEETIPLHTWVDGECGIMQVLYPNTMPSSVAWAMIREICKVGYNPACGPAFAPWEPLYFGDVEVATIGEKSHYFYTKNGDGWRMPIYLGETNPITNPDFIADGWLKRQCDLLGCTPKDALIVNFGDSIIHHPITGAFFSRLQNMACLSSGEEHTRFYCSEAMFWAGATCKEEAEKPKEPKVLLLPKKDYCLTGIEGVTDHYGISNHVAVSEADEFLWEITILPSIGDVNLDTFADDHHFERICGDFDLLAEWLIRCGCLSENVAIGVALKYCY